MPQDLQTAWLPHLAAARSGSLGWLTAHGFDRAAAEDLYADLTCGLLRSSTRPDVGQDPRAYVRVAVRRAASQRSRTRVPALSDEAIWSALDETPGPEELAAQREIHAALHAAIAALDEPFRTVLQRRITGRSIQEVATELGIPEATVATRTHRGVARLRQRMGRFRALMLGLLGQLSRRCLPIACLGLLVGPVNDSTGMTPQPRVEQRREEAPRYEQDHLQGFPYAEGWTPCPCPEA
ncbi:MAG: sigma-70 family RNA polymerase sigma factor [Planctomycetota bacterium]|nr:sigma-70 family RNA polymerase sigma factor [Planctomycetota bacterium]